MKIVFMMKKRIAFSIILFLFSIISFSQKNIIKAGFISNGGTNYGLQYERLLTDQIAIIGQIGFVYLLNNLNSFESNFDFLYGSGIYVEGRYYFSNHKNALQGWHGGLFFNSLNTIFESDVSNDYLNRKGAGAVFGYQWKPSTHLSIDILLGGSFMKTSTNLTDYNDGFFPLLGFNLGYIF